MIKKLKSYISPVHSDFDSTFKQMGLVERHGYPSEEHYVTTEDGYNLKIHRIPDSPLSNNKQPNTVVLLLHGILCSSDCWVVLGPKKDFGKLSINNARESSSYNSEITNFFSLKHLFDLI